MAAAARVILAACLASLSLLAIAAPPPVSLRSVASGLSAPLAVTHAGDGSGRLFIVEKGGRIKILKAGAVLATPFLDVGALISTTSERGLLGLAFHPQFASNRRFFVFYTRAADGALRVSSFVANAGNPDIADPASEREVITIDHAGADNHNGGHLAFGPDGFLYVATGDGGGGGDPNNNGQNLNSLLGKLLRLDVSGHLSGQSGYAIPPSNPFVGQAGADEIWAYGLRNPWRFSFDRSTGDLYIGDVGQGSIEEVNFQAAGAPGGRNYGWRVFEGNSCFSPSTGCSLANHTPPVITYGHNASGGFSITGGYAYRGARSDLLQSYYLYGDFVSNRIWAARQESGAWNTTVVSQPPSAVSGISSFGEDEAGEIHLASFSNGQVFVLESPNSADTVFTMAGATLAVTEGAGSASVIVNRGGSTASAVSVNFATSNVTAIAGTHYSATSGTLNWIAGDGTPKTIAVPIIDNGTANAARTFNVTLSAPMGGVLGPPVTTNVSIADDDNSLQFSAATASVTEGAPNVALAVTRTGATAGPASVTWTTANGTALSGNDFGVSGDPAPVTGTLSWTPGDAATQTITIPILDDAVVEATKSFAVSLSGPTGAGTAIGANGSATVTLNDNEASIAFGAPSYSVIEGGPTLLIPIVRIGSVANATTVTWSTANGTATAGQDFATAGSPAQRTGVLSWGAGDASVKSITLGQVLAIVPILNDTTLEGDESFTISLSNPTGGVSVGNPGTTTITIVDNESSFQFATPTLSVGETGTNGTLTVSRTGSFATAATVMFTTAAGTATAASDFTQTSGTLSWAAGDGAPKTITVGPVASPAPHIAIINDAVIESPETFTAALSAPTGGGVLGANATATVTITSEDAGIAMAAATQSVAEAAGTAVVTVNRAGSTANAISVNFTTVNGTALAGSHYTTTAGTLSWAIGDATPKTITVPVIDNAVVSTNRTFNVTLSGPVGAALGTPATTTVTIADDDNTLQFTAGTATVAEGTANLVLTVSRLGGAANAASVTFTTANGTALSGTDFGVQGVPADVTGTLNWAAGDAASKTVTIPILNDVLVEGAKTFTVNLSAPTGTGTSIGAIATVMVTLNDNDAGVVLSNASYLVNENTPSLTLTVNRIGPTTSAATVTWTTANGSATSGTDFGLLGNAAQRTGMLSWAAGDASAKTFTIAMLNEALAEGNETFTVTLSNPSAGIVLGTPSTSTVTIIDDETAPESTLQFSIAKTVAVEGSGPAVLSVTRTGSGFTFPVSVNFTMAAGSALAGSDYTASSGTLSWAAGDSTAKTITIPITNDAIAENPEQFTVTLSAPTPGAGLGSIAVATVAVIDDDEAFPLDGAIPAGWGIPGGAAGGWHVNNEPGAFEGVYTLKSDLINDSESAQIEVTGNYLAGTVSFRVRVSSELNFDRMRFYIDGVQAGQWSGTANTAWQVFSAPVAAGAHTFRWSYEKDGSESAGFDAAWIDAVVLPPPGP